MIEITLKYRKPQRKPGLPKEKPYKRLFNGLPITENKWNSPSFCKHSWLKAEYKKQIYVALMENVEIDTRLAIAKLNPPFKITFMIYSASRGDSDRYRTKELQDEFLKFIGQYEVRMRKVKGKFKNEMVAKDNPSILPERPQVYTVSVKHREAQKTIIKIERYGK